MVSLAGHEDLGELVARVLGRPHHVLDPARLHAPGTLRPKGGSVLVVARSRALTLSVLMPLPWSRGSGSPRAPLKSASPSCTT
ncbi:MULTISPECIES: hypothetical protein [Streptomyces]|uniref:Uncharacterized protein n=1 Tax=Streptomyces eurythermus TaxID=42237 RepID=A0ABW6Z3Q7_9ACTN|nr:MULTISPECIES: hypothetical protein [Streptomyces]QIS75135.1 hypothetical protein HB370_38565 [Streptomyces sp. DSM 40868]